MKRFRAILTADSAVNLGKISGIQFRLHYSWFVILGLVVYALSNEYFPLQYPGWSFVSYLLTGAIAALVFFASVVAHELAHSFVARRNGMPVKSITLFIFGGVAHITREADRARAELAMAAAGPACSILLGALFALVWFLVGDISVELYAATSWLTDINLILAVFNLIPGFPLDGGRIFHAILWSITGNYRASIRIATWAGQGIGYLFITAGVLLSLPLERFLPWFPSGDWFGGLWLAVIGWFLARTASLSYRHIKGRANLAGLTASRVMTANYRVVPPYLTLENVMQEQRILTENLVFLVADESGLRGTVTVPRVLNLPREQWGATLVKDIMVPGFQTARPDQDAASVMEQMDESGRSQVAVVSEGNVVGVIARDTLMKLL